MRLVGGIRGVLVMSAPAVLMATVGVGCGGQRASSQELPVSPAVEVTIVGELLPGDQRAPESAPTVTTAAPRPSIGRATIPVPVRPPMTAPPRS